jgi:hypothetical protein
MNKVLWLILLSACLLPSGVPSQNRSAVEARIQRVESGLLPPVLFA